MFYISRFFALGFTVLVLTGCMTTDPYTGERKFSNKSIGSAMGAIGGGLIGAVASGGKTEGILIGASVGAFGGVLTGSYWDKQESELRSKLRNTGVRVVRTKKELQLIMPGDITFKQSSSDVRKQFYPVLGSIALVLRKYNKTLVNITGYASSEGNATYNQKLSEKRAKSISQYFQSQSIKQQRLIDKGFGARHPIASNKTKEGRVTNRRVTISLTKLS